MGLVHIDEDLAYDEIFSLISGQWENGLIAQITFNPEETKYFPGPQFWGTEAFSTGEIITSGITQPPLLGYSVAYVYKHAKNRTKATKFLKRVLPHVLKYHDYLSRYRDPETSGLLTIVHPWESGTDNSPRWDIPMQNIPIADIPNHVKEIVQTQRTDMQLGDAQDRPGIADYYRYIYLVDLYRSWKWDYEKIVTQSPFAVKDILFSSLWCASNEALVDVLISIGETTDAKRCKSWAEQTRLALIGSWDKKAGQFAEIDVSRGQYTVIPEDTIAQFIPIFAGAYTEEQFTILLKKLRDKKLYASRVPIPSTGLDSQKFDLTRYWRGPSWPITNLFLIEGMKRRIDDPVAQEFAKQLIEKTLSMIAANGFFEYYNPTGDAIQRQTLGFGSFSWTAAILLYLLHSSRHPS
jgi:hypothetical protein